MQLSYELSGVDEFDTGKMMISVPNGQTHSLVRDDPSTVRHKISRANTWSRAANASQRQNGRCG